jgi:hypothetical protein
LKSRLFNLCWLGLPCTSLLLGVATAAEAANAKVKLVDYSGPATLSVEAIDKYNLFVSTGSTGMDDVYGNRVATFRRLLANHIERGLWYRVHYHAIGDGLSSSTANFRAALEIAREHRKDLRIAGMADIHKYQTERRGSGIKIESGDARRTILKLSCTTELELYDQPLTLEARLPKSMATERILVTNHQGLEVESRPVPSADGVVLRFDVKPIDAEYTIEKAPREN